MCSPLCPFPDFYCLPHCCTVSYLFSPIFFPHSPRLPSSLPPSLPPSRPPINVMFSTLTISLHLTTTTSSSPDQQVSSVAEPLAKAATMSPAPVSPASPPLKPTVSVKNDMAAAPEAKVDAEGANQPNKISQAPSNASNRIHPGPTDEALAPPGGVAPPPIPCQAPMSESKEGEAAPEKKVEVQAPQEAAGADSQNEAGNNRPQSSGVLAPTETPSSILLKISPSSGLCLQVPKLLTSLPPSLHPSLPLKHIHIAPS